MDEQRVSGGVGAGGADVGVFVWSWVIAGPGVGGFVVDGPPARWVAGVPVEAVLGDGRPLVGAVVGSDYSWLRMVLVLFVPGLDAEVLADGVVGVTPRAFVGFANCPGITLLGGDDVCGAAVVVAGVLRV